MALIPVLEELPVPVDQILWQANGNIFEAMAIAAAYGYGCACRDLEQTTKQKKVIIRRRS